VTLTDWLVELFASKVESKNENEGIQPKLNRIAQRDSFRAHLKDLCEEFEYPEHLADYGKRQLYFDCCQWTMHIMDFEEHEIRTNGSFNALMFAIPMLAYLREYNFPHRYGTRGNTVKWPLP